MQLLATLAALALTAPAAGPHPYPAPTVTVEGDTVTVRFAPTAGAEVPTHPVPYTAEPFGLFVADGQLEAVREADIVGSGLALDLTGDGDTDDALKVRCEGPVARIGDARVQPLGGALKVYTTPDGEPKPVRLGAQGATAVLYGDCGAGTFVGLAPPKAELPVHSTPGPMLQVSIVAPIEKPTDDADRAPLSWTLDGKAVRPTVYRVRSYEPIGPGEARWHAVHWAVLPVPGEGAHTLKVKVGGSAEGVVAVGVNVAPSPGVRHRGPMAVAPLK